MKRIFLVLNILAITLPFLGAEVQNQEQLTCHENDERFINKKTIQYIPIHSVLSSHPYYQYRPAAPINNQYMPFLYAIPVAVKPHTQIHQWQVQPIGHQHTTAHHPFVYPPIITVSPKKTQEKTVVPTVNTMATVEPTLPPTIDPTVKMVITPETSSESIITSTIETTTAPVTTPMV
ncbi:PREDICTED: kappa-casein [Condylura cristata]|uniref:kappa-casein n=1 Tax=Condylura cristata TaxID=143302 RepID=UPI00033449B2|nr:PREDICTED: kappa-casein [Condylura cristata]